MGVTLHAFGPQAGAPVSSVLYIYVAAAVVVLSFALVAALAGGRTGERAVRYPRLAAPALLALGRSRAVRAAAGGLGVLLLLAVVVTGLAGSQDGPRNPAQYLVWVYFWAGLVVLSGLVGNLWALLNPWAALHDLLARGGPRAPRRLPDRLGIWPAVAGLVLFSLFELASGLASRPAVVAGVAIGYTAVTLAGMRLFGRDAWLERCEGFSVLFGVIGRFGPVEAERDAGGRLTGVWLRPWGAGLLRPQRAGWDWVVLVMAMLAALAFDGLTATPAWRAVQAGLPEGVPLLRSAGLLVLVAAFLAVFAAFARLMLFLGGGRDAAGDELATVTAFALTLVPIALVYGAAHNSGYLALGSQALLPLLADPLGRGWRLLPAAALPPGAAPAGASTLWAAQVTLVVLGHVVAVFLAHLRAGERFRSAQRALLSQYPMLLLMVALTTASLWVLAQPLG